MANPGESLWSKIQNYTLSFFSNNKTTKQTLDSESESESEEEEEEESQLVKLEEFKESNYKNLENILPDFEKNYELIYKNGKINKEKFLGEFQFMDKTLKQIVDNDIITQLLDEKIFYDKNRMVNIYNIIFNNGEKINTKLNFLEKKNIKDPNSEQDIKNLYKLLLIIEQIQLEKTYEDYYKIKNNKLGSRGGIIKNPELIFNNLFTRSQFDFTKDCEQKIFFDVYKCETDNNSDYISEKCEKKEEKKEEKKNMNKYCKIIFNMINALKKDTFTIFNDIKVEKRSISPILFFYGLQGVGKSVLINYIVYELQNIFKNKNNVLKESFKIDFIYSNASVISNAYKNINDIDKESDKNITEETFVHYFSKYLTEKYNTNEKNKITIFYIEDIEKFLKYNNKGQMNKGTATTPILDNLIKTLNQSNTILKNIILILDTSEPLNVFNFSEKLKTEVEYYKIFHIGPILKTNILRFIKIMFENYWNVCFNLTENPEVKDSINYDLLAKQLTKKFYKFTEIKEIFQKFKQIMTVKNEKLIYSKLTEQKYLVIFYEKRNIKYYENKNKCIQQNKLVEEYTVIGCIENITADIANTKVINHKESSLNKEEFIKFFNINSCFNFSNWNLSKRDSLKQECFLVEKKEGKLKKIYNFFKVKDKDDIKIKAIEQDNFIIDKNKIGMHPFCNEDFTKLINEKNSFFYGSIYNNNNIQLKNMIKFFNILKNLKDIDSFNDNNIELDDDDPIKFYSELEKLVTDKKKSVKNNSKP